jgi:heme-degrading monooxygenase HmoA
MISYSEWEDENSIERYRKSEAHAEIKNHTQSLLGGRPVVKRYELAA